MAESSRPIGDIMKYITLTIMIIFCTLQNANALNHVNVDFNKIEQAIEALEQYKRVLTVYQDGKVHIGRQDIDIDSNDALKIWIENKLDTLAIDANTKMNDLKSEITK